MTHVCAIYNTNSGKLNNEAERAERKRDEPMFRQIRLQGLIAREAQYYKHCKRDYARLDNRHSTTKVLESYKIKDAHDDAFSFICSHIEENILASES